MPGTPITFGDEFLVNEHLSRFQSEPQVVLLADGRVLFVFRTDDPTDGDDDSWGVSGRIGTVQPDGSMQFGDEFRVNDHVFDEQAHPQAIQLADGRILFLFRSDSTPDDLFDGTDIAARIGTARQDGSVEFGEEFMINLHTAGTQIEPEGRSVARRKAGLHIQYDCQCGW